MNIIFLQGMECMTKSCGCGRSWNQGTMEPRSHFWQWSSSFVVCRFVVLSFCRHHPSIYKSIINHWYKDSALGTVFTWSELSCWTLTRRERERLVLPRRIVDEQIKVLLHFSSFQIHFFSFRFIAFVLLPFILSDFLVFVVLHFVYALSVFFWSKYIYH